MPTLTCPTCGAANDLSDAGMRFCYRCGGALPVLPPPNTGQQPATQQTIMLSQAQQQDTVPGVSASPVTTSNTAFSVPSVAYQSDSTALGKPTMSALAIISLICGIASFIPFVPFLACIGAIITGHMARREIRNSNGMIRGFGLATAGMILGYLDVVIGLILMCAFVAIMITASFQKP